LEKALNLAFKIPNISDYQEKKEQYVKSSFGFRNWALRLDHQLAYSFYNSSKVHAVVVGQEGYLYDFDYILEHNGKFAVDEAKINTKLDRFKQVQDTLQKLGKHLFVVIGPNKADFFPEFLPAKDQIPREGLKTNYDYYIRGMKNRQINHIDANGWFMQMKGKKPYPLYPQTGIHFSFYGAALFADTIISHVENALQKDLPDFGFAEVEWGDEPREEDDDLEEALNIIANIPSYKLPYPKVTFNEKGKYKPKALTIGDSFYWRFVNWDGLDKMYNQGQFWYYNKDAHFGKASGKQSCQVSELNFAQEIQDAEVICLLMASVNLWRFGFDFDDQLYQHFFGAGQATVPNMEELIQAKMQEARNNKEWLAYIQKKADEKGRPLDEVLREEAVFEVKKALGQ